MHVLKEDWTCPVFELSTALHSSNDTSLVVITVSVILGIHVSIDKSPNLNFKPFYTSSFSISPCLSNLPLTYFISVWILRC